MLAPAVGCGVHPELLLVKAPLVFKGKGMTPKDGPAGLNTRMGRVSRVGLKQSFVSPVLGIRSGVGRSDSQGHSW